jgi:predicted transposase YbfD/YdcC
MRYRDEPLNTLAAAFAAIDDPRDNRGKRHRLVDIFVLAAFGLLWGHTDFTNMARELRYHEAYFTRLLGLPNGIPSHDTFSAAFSVVNPAEFLECFIQWLVDLARPQGRHVAIDGKAVRAACDKVHGGKVPMLVNAFMVDTGVCIGQVRVDAKTNEIMGIPELLGWLDLDGAVVTADAIGCQRGIAGLLAAKGADFVLPVKENQPALRGDVLLELETVAAAQRLEAETARRCAARGGAPSTPIGDKLGIHQEYERGHSRIERRTYYVWNDAACVDKGVWPWVEAVGMVVRERATVGRGADGGIVCGEPTEETGVYIISRRMGAEEFACLSRGHWAIENALHWVLDDALREDRCTARRGRATENLALMRKVVYNLLKLDDAVKGMSVRAKQVYFRNNPDAVCRLLFEVVPGARA